MRTLRRLTIIGVMVACGTASADMSREAGMERAHRGRWLVPSGRSLASVDFAFEGRMAWPVPVRPVRVSRPDEVKTVAIEPLGIVAKDLHQPAGRRSANAEGVLVAVVTEGGVAHECGVCVGDRILRVDGALVSTAEDLSCKVESCLADSQVSLTIIHPREKRETVLDARLM